METDSYTRRLLKDPQKRRAWVMYQLSIRGRSMADVAAEAGVKRQTLYGVWVSPYPRMEKLVADALGLRPATIFPERYDADGLPNRPMGRPAKKATTKKGKNNTRANRFNDKAKDAA